MKTFKWYRYAFIIISLLLCTQIKGQTTQQRMESILDTASIEQQVQGVIDIARVYNEHKVIHVTVANQLKGHVLDTLENLKGNIAENNQTIVSLNSTIDTLQSQLEQTQADLQQAIDTKQSILVLGAEINKTVYNSVMWVLLAGLIAIIVFLGLMYKRAKTITNQTKKDLDELKETHEQYRKDSRERYEKIVVKHHNELKKHKEL
ncbi:MAG: hypothetical protein ACOC31_04430 [Bacteroidota bacterium]